jgi:hypothetical protein
VNAIVPIAKVDLSVREATLDDVAFIDALQREHGKALGFLARSWIENKIKAGQVLVAEEGTQNAERRTQNGNAGDAASPFCVPRSALRVSPTPLGYVISQDKYLKREELGLIVQLCVVKGVQRNLIGATLVKAAFERAAYGCRLFCLWCAQDLAANRFWEAMGFVPLAYRAGSEKKRRVHIFWEKRIRQDDQGQGGTPWWFPSTTGNGAMRADRVVLPIPPGKHWSDEMPVIEPAGTAAARELPDAQENRRATMKKEPAKTRRDISIASGGIRFGPVAPTEPAKEKKPKQGGREKKPKAKIDPKLQAAVRELRDRALEHFNSGTYVFEDAGKYDVSRALPDQSAVRNPQSAIPLALLPAA